MKPSAKRSVPCIDITKEVQTAEKALTPALRRLKTALCKLDPAKLPQGALSDLLYDLRATMKMVPALAAAFDDVLRPAEKTIEDHIIATLKIGESSGVQGAYSRTQVTENIVPVVEDWPKFYAYVRKYDAFELLNRAVNRDAMRERWEAKKHVPGVSKFHARKVSCTKLNRKK